MSLDIYFLNVGHGDCTFVKFDSGRLMMVDINNSPSLPESDEIALAEAAGVPIWTFRSGDPLTKRSWEAHYTSLLIDPHDFYLSTFAGTPVFRYIQTHPDLDHMSGLYRFFWQDKVPLSNMWDTENVKELDEKDFATNGYEYLDWLAYQLLRVGRGPDPEDSHKVLHNTQGETASYWAEDGIEVLAPTNRLLTACNDAGVSWNNASYVLRITYGGRAVILPGDAEGPVWGSLLEHPGPEHLRCDVLKAAHHGRESGFHEAAMEAASPSIVICSVGKKPDTDASYEYAALGARVLSTRFHGTIHVQVWYDGEVWVNNYKGERIDSLPPISQ